MVTDLNLLRVLDALLETGSVTTAARQLHLSPSAVSRALGRLRQALDDPLFVRIGREFQPTPRALDLRAGVREALATAESVLRPQAAPDPREIRRTFTISADDALTAGLACALVDDLAEHAPGIAVRFITDDAQDTALDTGVADLDLGIAPDREHLRAEALFDDHYVMAAHPVSRLHATRSLAAALRPMTHVNVARNHVLRGLLALHLPATERSVEVPSYLAAAQAVVADVNAFAVLPARLVRRFGAPRSLEARRVPFDLPELRVAQSWHLRNDADPAHRWLRSRLRTLATATR